MKVSVRVRGEWLAVPCRDGRQTVRWLGEEALRRYLKLKPSSYLDGRTEKVFQIRKTRGGAIIDGDDVIRNVLDDNEFLSVVLETDRPSPVTGPAEITYVPEQVYPLHNSTRSAAEVTWASLSDPEILRAVGGRRHRRCFHQGQFCASEYTSRAEANALMFIATPLE